MKIKKEGGVGMLTFLFNFTTENFHSWSERRYAVA